MTSSRPRSTRWVIGLAVLSSLALLAYPGPTGSAHANEGAPAAALELLKRRIEAEDKAHPCTDDNEFPVFKLSPDQRALYWATKIVSNGTGSRGPGQAVRLKDGTTHFLDWLSDEELKNLAEPVKPNRSLDREGCSKSDFKKYDPVTSEGPADRRAQEEVFATFDSISPGIGRLLREKVSFLKSKAIVSQLDFGSIYEKWKDSPRVPSALQYPVALFTADFLMIQEPGYSAIPPQEKAWVWVHEGLRQIMEHADPTHRIDLGEMEAAIHAAARKKNTGPLNSFLGAPTQKELEETLIRLRNGLEKLDRQRTEENDSNVFGVLTELLMLQEADPVAFDNAAGLILQMDEGRKQIRAINSFRSKDPLLFMMLDRHLGKTFERERKLSILSDPNFEKQREDLTDRMLREGSSSEFCFLVLLPLLWK